jgi:hypothetical protein
LRTQAQTEHQRDVERSELRTMEEAVLPRLAREQMEARHAADL